MSDYLVGRHALEPWYDSVPRGKAQLWISTYTFAPTEMGVLKWNKPEKIDSGEAFIVWTDQEKRTELQDMGASPEHTWQDGNGWKDDVNDLDGAPVFMAAYDSLTSKWIYTRIKDEASEVPAGAKGLDARFTSSVFRRSVNPPVTPTGGNYRNPIPNSGSILASFLYAVIPNWQLFWKADALAADVKIPVSYVLYGAVYSVLMVAFLMVMAIILFGDREVGNQIIG